MIKFLKHPISVVLLAALGVLAATYNGKADAQTLAKATTAEPCLIAASV